MSDVVVDAPVSSVDLIGRPVFVVADQRVTEIASTRGEAVFTADDPFREGSEVVALPVLGEFLRTWNGSREVNGHWLGLTREGAAEGRLEALVMEGSQVQRVTFEPGNVDARRVPGRPSRRARHPAPHNGCLRGPKAPGRPCE